MNCNCMSKVLEKAKAKIISQLPKHDPESLSVDWANGLYGLGGKAGLTYSVGLPIAIKYRRLKNNGQPYSNATKNDVNIFMSFCPFCGEPQDDGGEQDVS